MKFKSVSLWLKLGFGLGLTLTKTITVVQHPIKGPLSVGVRSDGGTTVGLAVGCCQGPSHGLNGKLNPAQEGSARAMVG